MTLATLDAPHLLILDEPTNHLDIESREALIHALNDYQGAVILIAHDSHLVEATADRLWLVANGSVSRFDEDMTAYKRLLLAERGAETRDSAGDGGAKKAARRDAAATRRTLQPLRDEVKKCEARVAKLEAMRAEIDARLAAPDLYERATPAQLEAINKKHGEILSGLERAEALWMEAEEALENAQAET